MQEHAEGPRSRPMVLCPECGTTNKPGAMKCASCGAKLDPERPAGGKPPG
jgi:hypothetical protein